MADILISVSAGELFDKLTILEIKEARISEPEKLEHIRKELESLRAVITQQIPSSSELEDLHTKLRDINASIWDSEDAVRHISPETDPETYLSATYNSHKKNEERFKVKRAINELCNSSIQEQKNYV
jgi:hypothetical protein